MELTLKHAIMFPIVFAAFFSCPILVEYMIKKYGVRIVGAELAALVMPIIAIVGFYKDDWDMGVMGLGGWAGLWLGFWFVWHRASQK